MIVYTALRSEFTRDVFSNQIESKVLAAFKLKVSGSVSPNEIQSWKNSLQYINNVLLDGEIPGDAGVAIEYKVPLTSKHVDFILTGADRDRNDKEDPDRARTLADRIIKNTYRTLMTRGQKGCYLFCVDEETNEFFRRFVESPQAPFEAESYLPMVADPAAGYSDSADEPDGSSVWRHNITQF